MLYKIADFYIDILCRYLENEKIFSPYLVDKKCDADFVISASDKEIDAEHNTFVSENGDIECLPSYLERIVMLRKLSGEILSRGAFLMHGALIEYEGAGYMFCAPSGTGKTTHIRLWQKLFGAEKVTIVNGDKPFLRVIDGEIYGYGTPWCGKECYNTNTRVKLSSICFIERAKENSILQIAESEAIPRLFGQIEVKNSQNLKAQLEMLDILVNKVDMYLLRCNKQLDAAKIAYEGMKKA